MSKEPYIGQKLKDPDGDICIVTKVEEHKNEEDSNGIYDAKTVKYVLEGDKSEQEFTEYLDSRDGYQYHIMNPLN